MTTLQNITLYNDDCLAVLPSIPDKSIDCIICDLPYGTTDCDWDSIIPFEPLWAHYKRIIKPKGILYCLQAESLYSSFMQANRSYTDMT